MSDSIGPILFIGNLRESNGAIQLSNLLKFTKSHFQVCKVIRENFAGTFGLININLEIAVWLRRLSLSTGLY